MKNNFKAFLFVVSIIFMVSCGNQQSKPSNNSTNDTIKNDSLKQTTSNTDSASRNSADFKIFINYFLHTCYYNNNLDSLVFSSSTAVTSFMNSEAGFARYYNRGAFCNLFSSAPYDYPFTDKFYGEKCMYNDLNLFNKKPVEGFCEESKDQNGVYYYQVTEFPDAWDMNKDKAVKTKLPAKFEKVDKMKVDVLVDKYIAKQFYFAQIENIWYLVYIDDCDCSA